jgi:hypothetical protein
MSRNKSSCGEAIFHGTDANGGIAGVITLHDLLRAKVQKAGE